MSVFLFAVLCGGCQKTPTSKIAADEPAFRKPTATEVFNLRSKCVELAKKIDDDHDQTGCDVFRLSGHYCFFQQEHFSHYDPRTNRCNVELRVTLTAGAVDLKEAKNYEIYYANRFLYDGQTGDELASSYRGNKVIAPFGIIGIDKVDWSKADKEIDRLMADDRKQ